MDLTYTDFPVVKHQVYLKDRKLMYSVGGLLFTTICGLAYWFYLETSSAVPAIIFVVIMSFIFWSFLRLDFGKINHMIEMTPEFLRVDDCRLKEIAWRDIVRLKLEKRSSMETGRSALLIVYLKDQHKYNLPAPGGFLSRGRNDGGIFATNLYNYAGDYNEIFKQLCAAREGGQFVLWSPVRKRPH